MRRVVGLTEAQANERLQLESGAIAYYVAAIRECFEEAGILLARDRGGTSDGRACGALTHWRKAVPRTARSRGPLHPGAGELAYFGHWITAPGRSRRFNARFFVALAPQANAARTTPTRRCTTCGSRRARRSSAARAARSSWSTPTQTTLKDLSRFTEPRAAYEHARSLPEVEENRACWAPGQGRAEDLPPPRPAFRDPLVDPENRAVELRHHGRRAQAPRPLGDAPHRAARRDDRARNQYLHLNGAVIDPGRRSIRIEESWNSNPSMDPVHPHLDHSPAAAAVKAATGAQVLGRPAPAGQDATVQAGLRGRERRASTWAAPRCAIHTPGHARTMSATCRSRRRCCSPATT